jgi:peptidoglycan/LPS O-acetylase OafA/YrhL
MARYRKVAAAADGTDTVVERPPWSPAQIVAVIAGIVLVVVGGVALARSGVDFKNVPATHSTVAGLHFTSMSALIQLVAGVFLLAGGAYPDTAKASMAFWGAILLAFGLVVAIDSVPFFNMWGYTKSNGVFYAVIGGVVLVAAAVSPIIFSRRRVVSSQQPVEPYAPPRTGVRY